MTGVADLSAACRCPLASRAARPRPPVPRTCPPGRRWPTLFGFNHLIQAGATGAGTDIDSLAVHSLQPAVLGSYDRCVGTSLSPSAIDQSVVTDTPSTGGGPDFALDTLVLTLLAPQTHINVARFDPVMPLALPLMHLLQLGRTPNVLDVTVTYCESQVAPFALALSERLLSAFAASGTTSTAATGDRGSSGCYPQTPPSVTDPASSRFVVAIGGASFSGSAESPHDLLAWNRPRQFGGGGGASRAVMAPPWQSATKTGVTGPVDVHSPGWWGLLVPDHLPRIVALQSHPAH